MDYRHRKRRIMTDEEHKEQKKNNDSKHDNDSYRTVIFGTFTVVARTPRKCNDIRKNVSGKKK